MSEAASLEFVSESPEETRQIGRRLGRALQPGDVVLLNGDLGAGKTTLTQGIALGLGVKDYVQSPTFTLVSEHAGELLDGRPVTLYHLDLYRLIDATDLESFGYDQYLAPGDGVSVIEWPERASGWLPETYLLVEISMAGAGRRRLSITTVGRPPVLHDEFIGN